MYLANRAPELFPGASFSVAHCNFGLRGEESDGDERFVREWCASKGVECFVEHFPTSEYASGKGISIEMAARELRYGWFAMLREEHGFDAVAVAHNACDNAETLMLNLLRGTGSRGIRGMSPDSCGIVRPLLGITRAQILDWMRSHGLEWREDSTNAENVYKRNIIRNEVFPIFGRINPAFIQTLGADMKRFAQVDDIAEDYFKDAQAKVCGADGSVSVDRLLELPHWEYVLWRLLEHASLSQPTFDKLTALLQKFKDSPRGTVTLGGKSFESPTHIITIRKGRIFSARTE